MKSLFISFLLIFISETTHAQKWAINEDHSEVFFSVPYLKISEVTGRFQRFKGELTLNNNNGPIHLILSIDVDSIETGNKMRDGHLKGNDFLQKARYPKITFSSRSIIQTKDQSFVANGM